MNAKYYWKTPAAPFERRRTGFCHSLDKAADRIEKLAIQSWHANPWIQLVEETRDGWRVVAEYRNHGARGWVGPLEAMGLKAHHGAHPSGASHP